MKNDTVLKAFKPLQKKMEKDSDPYLFIHFSREDNHFKGLTSTDMDMADALIVINHLVSRFKINRKALDSYKK
jgi:hypothetical protein